MSHLLNPSLAGKSVQAATRKRLHLPKGEGVLVNAARCC